jgi:acyl-CoA thioesterase I
MSTRLFGICNRLAALVIVASMIGCGGPESNSAGTAGEAGGEADGAAGAAGGGPSRDPGLISGTAATDTPETTAAANSERTVLFIGTSLTAGYGLTQAQSFPMLVERRIDEAGLPFGVVNAGVSGETSAGALRRVDWLLRQPFDVVVLETGANDMLRGVDPSTTEANIQAIIDRIRARHPDVPIVLAGMLALPNLGDVYGRDFETIYPRLAERNDLDYIPFLLEAVGGERDLNQSDGVHPNVEGHRLIADTVWRVLEPVLAELAR